LGFGVTGMSPAAFAAGDFLAFTAMSRSLQAFALPDKTIAKRRRDASRIPAMQPCMQRIDIALYFGD
jgi:hypothetical protein